MEIVKIETAKLKLNNGKIKGLPKNPRKFNKKEIDKLARSLRETPELFEMRPCIVVQIEDDYVVLGGNMRLLASKHNKEKEVPCIIIPQWTSVDKMKEIVIKDNGSFGEWDFELLSEEWEHMPLEEWGVVGEWGNDGGSAKREEMQEDDYDDRDNGNYREVTYGDIWQLGEHRLMCGDSTSEKDVRRLMGGRVADLVFTDPPYGMRKEAQGVINDNMNKNDLLDFNRKWIPISFANLKSNGSWYCWGIDEPLMDIYCNILKPMINEKKITFRNLITWDKGIERGQRRDGALSYVRADEKCLFVMCGGVELNRNKESYFEGFEPLRQYLETQAKAMGLTRAKLKEICGVQMYSHWFSKSQWELITEMHYSKLVKYCEENNINAFRREHEDIRREYEDIRREYEDIRREYEEHRPYFDNTHDNFNNVWHFKRTNNEERKLTGGHCTPKPIELCARAIKSSSRDGELVLDLFGGSGSTLIACEQLGRSAYLMEKSTKYCSVIINRWEKITGNKATKITDL